MSKKQRDWEDRLRKKIAKELVAYDKRYTVASLTILLDRIMPSISQELKRQRKQLVEEIEKMRAEPSSALTESIAFGKKPHDDGATIAYIREHNRNLDEVIKLINEKS